MPVSSRFADLLQLCRVPLLRADAMRRVPQLRAEAFLGVDLGSNDLPLSTSSLLFLLFSRNKPEKQPISTRSGSALSG